MAHIVGLSGIDGSGKTTVAREVVQVLSKAGVQTRYHHELDFAIGKLIVRALNLVLRGKRGSGVKELVLAQKEQNRPGVSFLYHLLVWMESLLAFVWFKVSPGVVVHDRWPYDFLLQFKSRGYTNRLVRFAFRRFPRPDTLILLRVPATVAYQRKRTDPGHVDDGPEYFELLAIWMEELAKQYRYNAQLDANVSIDDLTGEIVNVIAARIGLQRVQEREP